MKKIIQHLEFVIFQSGNEAALRKPYSLNTREQNSVQAANKRVTKRKTIHIEGNVVQLHSNNPHILKQT